MDEIIFLEKRRKIRQKLYQNQTNSGRKKLGKPNSCGNILIISVITVIFTSANSGCKWKNDILIIPALLRDLIK